MTDAQPEAGALWGKVAVVTGANRGIGKAIASELAGAGAAGVVGARGGPRGDAAAAAVRAGGF
jgi:dehydrogenase/reductase SDR family member 12